MNAEKFKNAKQAYDRGDYRSAARGFLESVEQGTPISNGAAYHMAGNALMKLRRHSDAVTAYNEALRDDSYLKHGAVEANLAQAELHLGNLNSALAHYEAALREPDYKNAYRCYLGVGEIMMQREEFESAAIAYRRAAVDKTNPDPGRALVNLGIALMAMGRAKDAAEAYKAALNVESYRNKGLVLSNLGIAYATFGEHRSAVIAFEEALELHDYQLNPRAQACYTASKNELRDEEKYNSADLRTLAADLAGQPTDTFGSVATAQATAPEASSAEASNAEEVSPAAQESHQKEELETEIAAETKPLEDEGVQVAREEELAEEAEVSEEEAALIEQAFTDEEPDFEVALELSEEFTKTEVAEEDLASFASSAAAAYTATEPEPPAPVSGVKVGSAQEVEEFFSRTDSEMRKISIERKKESAEPFKWLKNLSLIVIVLSLLVAGGYFALTQGFGIPSAESVVSSNLNAYNSGKPFESYWSANSNAIDQMAHVPIPSTYAVGDREADFLNASVIAAVSAEDAEPIRFEFRLERSVLSWKIVSIRIAAPEQAPVTDAQTQPQN